VPARITATGAARATSVTAAAVRAVNEAPARVRPHDPRAVLPTRAGPTPKTAPADSIMLTAPTSDVLSGQPNRECRMSPVAARDHGGEATTTMFPRLCKFQAANIK